MCPKCRGCLVVEPAGDGTIVVRFARCLNCGSYTPETPGDPVSNNELRTRKYAEPLNKHGNEVAYHPPLERPKIYQVRRRGVVVCIISLTIAPEGEADARTIAGVHGGDELTRVGVQGETGQWRNE